MGSTLPPFDKDDQCAKCGDAGAKVEYKGPSFDVSASGEMLAMPESMQRTCATCGFVWFQSCCDSAP